jgi:hypothetical protein
MGVEKQLLSTLVFKRWSLPSFFYPCVRKATGEERQSRFGDFTFQIALCINVLFVSEGGARRAAMTANATEMQGNQWHVERFCNRIHNAALMFPEESRRSIRASKAFDFLRWNWVTTAQQAVCPF